MEIIVCAKKKHRTRLVVVSLNNSYKMLLKEGLKGGVRFLFVVKESN